MEALVLVMTDVEGSTRLWVDEPADMDAAMLRHHAIVHAAIDEHDGWRPVDQGEGDSVFAAFRSPTAAIAAVVRIQRALAREPWPTSQPLRVRVALNIGEVISRDGNLYGDPVNRCARLRALAAGGQSLMTAALFEVARDRLPEGVGVVDLGEHRMKDLSRPERVYQLTGSGLDGPFPPLRSLDAVRHNLPVQTSSFVGREAQLQAVVRSVQEHRLTTITGFGGMGKTRLALQAAAELADRGLGDVWFVDLSAETDPATVPARIAETLGVRWGTGSAADALSAALREQPTLLVLDNLEQVLDCAEFVGTLLASTGALRVLATSREPLRLRGEQQLALPPMALPDPHTSSEQLPTYEAVRLFLDRAVAVRPGFSVDNESAPAVAAIVARLDGHPLALELAAVRLKVLSVDKLLERLNSALSVLTGGARDMPARHQALRATIAWSFDALTREEQVLLSRMSVLPGPADLELIESVCADHDEPVLDRLESLVEKSLVHVIEGSGEPLFGLLVSIAEFAVAQLDPVEAEALRDRHAAYVQSVLDRYAPWNQRLGLLAEVSRLLPHVRAAAVHLFARPKGEAAAHLVRAMDDTLAHLGLHAEFLDLSQRALALTSDPWDVAHLRCARAICLAHLGDSRRAVREGAQAVEAAERSGDPTMLAGALGTAVDMDGGVEQLQRIQARTAALLSQLGPEDAEVVLGELNNVTAATLRSLDPETAEAAARRAMQREEDVGRYRLALIQLDRGDVAAAESTYAPVRGKPVPFNGRMSWLPRGRAMEALLAMHRGELAEAQAQADQAIREFRARGVRTHLAAQVAAWAHSEAGDPATAIALLDEAIWSDAEDDVHNGSLRWQRAAVLLRSGDPTGAARDLELAHTVLAPSNRTREVLACLTLRATLLAETEPAHAARLLGCVAAHRKDWVLPFSLDREHDQLLAQLLPRREAEFDAGGRLDPHTTW